MSHKDRELVVTNPNSDETRYFYIYPHGGVDVLTEEGEERTIAADPKECRLLIAVLQKAIDQAGESAS